MVFRCAVNSDIEVQRVEISEDADQAAPNV
jgi:hypothetical protein